MAQAILGEHGVQVTRNPKGWEVGVHEVQLSPDFVSLFPSLKPTGKLSYQLLHADHVTCERALPSTWLNIGSSASCKVQGLLEPGRVLTYQGHPEFDRFLNAKSTAALGELGYLPPEMLGDLLKLVDMDDDRVLAGEVAVEFFLSNQPIADGVH